MSATTQKPLPSLEYLKPCLDYSPDTGALTWKERPIEHFKDKQAISTWNTRFAGKDAGTVNSKGYLAIRISGTSYLAHRLAWKLSTGDDPAEHIDHINGDKLDNRLCNLREATRPQNSRNRASQSNNTSGFKGAFWHKRDSKWVAQIRINGKKKHLGYFPTPEAAHHAYCQAATKYHGEFANFG